jgi:hypothetical protein
MHRSRVKRRVLAVAGMSVIAIGFSAVGASAQAAQVSQSFKLTAHADLSATAAQCDNTGSTVDISGTITIGGVTVQVTFKNNVKGTHTIVKTGDADLEITPAGGSVSVPKQPVFGGVGGNPWLSFQFTDDNGNPTSERILLGRCVQGLALNHISTDLLLGAGASALAQGLDCSNRGTTVSLTGTANHGAINGVLYLDNNKNKVVHEVATAAAVGITLTPAVTVQKQGNVGGAGGNPLISLQFLGDNGALGPVVDLGRCVKIG